MIGAENQTPAWLESTTNSVKTKLSFFGRRVSLSKKPPERVAFLSQIWYNEKGDKNAAKG